jgi:hypothetical protein
MVSQISPSRTRPATAAQDATAPSPRRQRHLPAGTGLAAALLLGALVATASWSGLRLIGADEAPRPPAGVSASPGPAPREAAQPDPRTQEARDRLARRAMPDSGTGRAYGSAPLATSDARPPIVLPPPTGIDEVGVATGYPQTRLAAIAQLAAIDQAALQSATLPGVRAVIGRWAAPGGPTASTWSGVTAMGGLLEDLHLSGAGSPHLKIVVTPAMGLIKGNVGADFTVACVVLTVDVAFSSFASSTPVADCQRMLWRDGRWVIGPGTEPAEAPSVWPDTAAALAAGYRDLVS